LRNISHINGEIKKNETWRGLKKGVANYGSNARVSVGEVFGTANPDGFNTKGESQGDGIHLTLIKPGMHKEFNDYNRNYKGSDKDTTPYLYQSLWDVVVLSVVQSIMTRFIDYRRRVMTLEKLCNEALKKIIVLAITMISVTNNSTYGQNNFTYPFRTERFEFAGSSIESIGEYIDEISNYMSEHKESSFTVRLCTKEKFEVAIPIASIEPNMLSDYLIKSKIEPPYVSADRIFVDRSEHCVGKSKTSIASELWFESKDNKVKNSIDKVNVCQISSGELSSIKDDDKNIGVGTYDHRKALKKFAEELKKRPNAVGVVIGNYVDNQSNSIKRKLAYAESWLGKSGLSKKQYAVKLMRWNGNPDIYEPKYLRFRIIEIKKEVDCKNLNTTVWYDTKIR
jgi:hypothetical protein